MFVRRSARVWAALTVAAGLSTAWVASPAAAGSKVCPPCEPCPPVVSPACPPGTVVPETVMPGTVMPENMAPGTVMPPPVDGSQPSMGTPSMTAPSGVTPPAGSGTVVPPTPSAVDGDAGSQAISDSLAPQTVAPPASTAPAAAPAQSPALASTASTGTQNFTPGMIGDFFSASEGGSIFAVIDRYETLVTDDGSPLEGPFNSTGSGPFVVTDVFNDGEVDILSGMTTGGTNFPLTPVAISTSVSQADIQAALSAGGGGGTIFTAPIQNNADVQALVEAQADAFYSSSGIDGTTIFIASGEPAAAGFAAPSDGGSYLFGDTVGGGGGGGGAAGSGTGYLNYLYAVQINATATDPQAAVGTQKLAEATSPLPRTRVFFNYSYFDNTPLTGTGLDVQRYTPGFEYAFNNNRTSIEARLPFAATLDSDLRGGQFLDNRNVELGDMTVFLKHLFSLSETFAFSGGLGISIPTSDDVFLQGLTAADQLQIESQSVHLYPFLGALFTPNDRLFVQSFLQFDFDTNGNDVNVTGFGGGPTSGVLNNQNNVFLDASVGYWIYQNFGGRGLITGLAPQLELHYNRSMGDADSLTRNNLSILGGNDIDLLNGTVGVTALLGDTAILTLGYATPLGGSPEQFDSEFRVSFNYFFGGPLNRQRRAF